MLRHGTAVIPILSRKKLVILSANGEEKVFRIAWKNSMSGYRQALKTARTEYIHKLIDNHQNIGGNIVTYIPFYLLTFNLFLKFSFVFSLTWCFKIHTFFLVPNGMRKKIVMAEKKYKKYNYFD